MNEQEKENHGGPKKMFELTEREKSGALYILGIAILIGSIVFLVSLTHVVLHP